MAQTSDFMKRIDHQIDTNADLKRKVKEYFNEMIIKERLTALRARRGLQTAMNVTSRGGRRSA